MRPVHPVLIMLSDVQIKRKKRKKNNFLFIDIAGEETCPWWYCHVLRTAEGWCYRDWQKITLTNGIKEEKEIIFYLYPMQIYNFAHLLFKYSHPLKLMDYMACILHTVWSNVMSGSTRSEKASSISATECTADDSLYLVCSHVDGAVMQ